MAVLTEIVRNVLIIVLVAGFLEMLLPEGNMKPLVRLCIGMFILIAVLNPVLTCFFSERNFQIGSWDYQPERLDQAADIEEAGARINQNLVGRSEKITKGKLEEQINAVAVLVPGVQSVDSQITFDDHGTVQSLYLSVKPTAGEDDEDEDSKMPSKLRREVKIDDETGKQLTDKLTNLIQNLYGFEGSSIKIVFEGG